MKKVVLIVIVTLLAWNCKEKEGKSKPQNEPAVTEIEANAPKLERGCYRYDRNNSVVLFEIEKTTDPVSGSLMYQLEGKDKNIGKFKGTLQGDRLIGIYTFQSEGKESSREVAFLVKEGELIEGYGELNGAGTSFKSYESIKFSSKMPLTKKECDL